VNKCSGTDPSNIYSIFEDRADSESNYEMVKLAVSKFIPVLRNRLLTCSNTATLGYYPLKIEREYIKLNYASNGWLSLVSKREEKFDPARKGI